MTTEQPTWYKSSYSSGEGGNCVEVAWFKSSHSNAEGGECVEVSATPATVHVRDSKDKTGPALTFTPASWAAFLTLATTTL
ncbi:DUF397 domain-containing protein [Kitasatospora sp. LaBMicrA B282]|uniref:DUF397 domain-containing protein n=1 Tax=Kitasatospora sp. LaBMicrA B282 TaxID=3420949 RepID=UPI003D0AB910